MTDSASARERELLAGAGVTVLCRPDAEEARVRFVGTLGGAPVEWQARVLTLHRLWTEAGGGPVQAVIEVRAVDHGVGDLLVALPVARIDAPVLVMTATMVRQWKGLGGGRHAYGPAVEFSPAKGL